jgi:enamidase
MTTTLLRNIGKLVSGDVKAGLLDADSVLVVDGKVAVIGREQEIAPSQTDHVVDVQGMVLAPGLVDGHTHQMIGDWHPRQSVIGWMEGVLHGGVTSIITMGASVLQGLPTDAAGAKALAVLGAKTGQNYRPGGGLKVHGGAIFLRPGLTREDFQEMAREGVKVVAEIGGGGLFEYEEVKDYVNWAKEAGMVVPVHFGGRSVPGSGHLYAEEVIALDPDVVVHINGGPTSAPLEEAEQLIDGTSAYLEVIHNGNYRTMYEFTLLMKERNLLHRCLIGTDSPVGAGVMPLGMLRTALFISSLCQIPAATVWAMASGSVADAYRLNTGKVEVGREADFVVLDAPLDCFVDDGLSAIEYGDVPAIVMIMVDGEIIALRARNTTLTERRVIVDGETADFRTRETVLLP